MGSPPKLASLEVTANIGYFLMANLNYRTMNKRFQEKISANKIIGIVLFSLFLLFLLEPVFREKLIFALTYTDSITSQTNPQRSHAPEPSTLFLLSSGLLGMVIRFAQKSFIKFKRAMDYFLSIFGLTIASPLLLLTGIMIKLTSKGPIIYKQYRVGRNGRIFKIYKLRTMRVDAENKTGAVWAKANDPRITSLGRILRKCHIDELPQLFNVLKGEMSIVGPRPERPEMVRDLKELIHDYEKRLQVDPGITGLAQVRHKYDETIEDVKKKIKYDLVYIKKMCWIVEFRILAQTFIVALTGKGAR